LAHAVLASGIVVLNKQDVRDTTKRRWHRSDSAQARQLTGATPWKI